MNKYLIVNADDFGASRGVNQGIIDCHARGIVTNTSLMVTGNAVDEAVSLSREHPHLSIFPTSRLMEDIPDYTLLLTIINLEFCEGDFIAAESLQEERG